MQSLKTLLTTPRMRVVIVLAGLGLLYAVFNSSRSGEGENEKTPLFEVKEGPLVISITEAGTISPREVEIIKSQVQGRASILYLIPEGTRVKEGELLVELDASQLEDKKVDQEIRLQNAEAAFVRSRENREVADNQAKSDIDKAGLTLRFAKEDLTKYREGEYPNELKSFEAKITLAAEDVQRKEEKLKWSRVLFEEKYLSESELQADELAAKKAKLEKELAENNLALLKDYTYKRKIAELESNVSQAEMALERVKRKASADIVQAEADLRAKEAEFKRQKSKLDKIVGQIGKAKIFAPREGLVVYATSTKFSWRGNTEPLSEGQEVRERQELIHLPTASTYIAEINIHESSLKKVRSGLPVRIEIDALPGSIFHGNIEKIAPLPDPQSVFMNPDLKVYKTKIAIDGGQDVLRTGMTCKAEVLVADYEKAIYAPIQCVVRQNGQPVVYLAEGGETKKRTVKIGLDNNRMVHLIEGVEPGESLLLAPPLTGSSDPAAVAANQSKEFKKAIPESKFAEQEEKSGEKSGGQKNVSDEDRAKQRERFQNMSPEQREAMRKRRQQRKHEQEG